MLKILILIILIILLFLILFKKENNNNILLGSSYRTLYDIGNYENYNKIIDDLHIDYINIICDYINNIEVLNNNDKFIIIGDVHGSILQMFMPLKQAGILENIIYKNEKFNYKLNKNYNGPIVIYCGDFFGRCIYSTFIEEIITFINIYNEMKDKIIWVFGNHDVDFFRCELFEQKLVRYEKYYVFDIELNEMKQNKNYNKMKNMLYYLIKNNKYPCIYYNDEYKFTVSHTTFNNEKLNNLFMKFNKNNNFESINEISKLMFKKTNDKGDSLFLYITKVLYWDWQDDLKNIYTNGYNMFVGHMINFDFKNEIYNEYLIFKENDNYKINDNIKSFFNKKIEKYKKYNIDITNDFIKDEIKRLEFKDYIYKKEVDINTFKKDNNVYGIDVGATYGLDLIYFVDEENKKINPFELENDKIKVNFIPFDTCCNMSMFAIIDKNNNYKMSKIYMI